MFLQPQLKKLKKEKRGKLKGSKIDSISFGTFGIKAVTKGKLTSKQIEMCRRIISKRIKGVGKMWIRIFPRTPITSKPKSSRMGKGKGDISFWVCNIIPGKILYEVDGVSKKILEDIIQILRYKLNIKLVLVQE